MLNAPYPNAHAPGGPASPLGPAGPALPSTDIPGGPWGPVGPGGPAFPGRPSTPCEISRMIQLIMVCLVASSRQRWSEATNEESFRSVWVDDFLVDQGLCHPSRLRGAGSSRCRVLLNMCGCALHSLGFHIQFHASGFWRVSEIYRSAATRRTRGAHLSAGAWGARFPAISTWAAFSPGSIAPIPSIDAVLAVHTRHPVDAVCSSHRRPGNSRRALRSLQHLGAHLLGGSGSRGTRLRRSSDIDCLGCEGAACARSRRAMARAAITASHAVGDLPDTIDLGLKGDGGKAEGVR